MIFSFWRSLAMYWTFGVLNWGLRDLKWGLGGMVWFRFTPQVSSSPSRRRRRPDALPSGSCGMRADERENSARNRDWRSCEEQEEEKQSVSFPGMKKKQKNSSVDDDRSLCCCCVVLKRTMACFCCCCFWVIHIFCLSVLFWKCCAVGY